MSSHTRDAWPAQAAQARAIVDALGSGWVLQNASHEPAEWQCWEARRLADGLTVAFDWPQRYGAAKGKLARLEISGVWPVDGDGQKRIVRPAYGAEAPTTSITVDASKSAEVIAKDILRRLILPSTGFEPAYLEACRLIVAAQTAATAQAQTIAAILAAEPGAHTSRNSGPNVIYLGATSHGYTLRVDTATSIRFEPFNVDLPAALRILVALRKGLPTVCDVCGTPISAAQAGLSMARAEGAAAWCADCCTAALTTQREHEEADPHCTCTDCIASHAAMLDGQNGIL
jgi:hypothetical protein